MKVLQLAMQQPLPLSCVSSSTLSSYSLKEVKVQHHDADHVNTNGSKAYPTVHVVSAPNNTSSPSTNSNYQHQHEYGKKIQNDGQHDLNKLILMTMMKQESTTYKCRDYIYSSQPRNILLHPQRPQDDKKQTQGKNDSDRRRSFSQMYSPKSTHSFATTATTTSMMTMESTITTTSSLSASSTKKQRLADISCRHKICEWTYRVINFFNINRETVYYTLSYLDRFMMKYKTDRHTYKLLATTALFLALKVHQPRKLVLKNVVHDLSKGEFDMADVDQMELVMLGALGWSLHPPSPINFVARLLDLQKTLIDILNQNYFQWRSSSVPSSKSVMNNNIIIDDSDYLFFNVERIQAYSVFFAELSVFDYYFVMQNPSRIALASILNTIEGLGLFEAVSISKSTQIKRSFYTLVLSMHNSIHIDINKKEDQYFLSLMRKKLWVFFENSEEKIMMKEAASKDKSAISFERREGYDGLENIKINLSRKTNNDIESRGALNSQRQ